VSDAVSVPVIASGGMGKTEDMIAVIDEGHADAVAMADILHYQRMPFAEIRAAAISSGITLRQI
jgi:cyclase